LAAPFFVSVVVTQIADTPYTAYTTLIFFLSPCTKKETYKIDRWRAGLSILEVRTFLWSSRRSTVARGRVPVPWAYG
jgi:hypothetical protein